MTASGNSYFLFVTGMVRAMENRLLGRGSIELMLRAGTGDEALAVLRNTRYSAFPDLTREPFFIDPLIKNARSELFEFIDKYSGDTEAGYIFRLDYDYHNMKILLRRKISGGGKGDLLSDLGNVNVELMEDVFEHELYELLPPVMRESVSTAIEVYFTQKKGALINPVFDRHLFADMLNSTASKRSPVIRNYIRRRIDAVNIMTLLRHGTKSAADKYADYLFIVGGFIEAELFRDGLDAPLKTAAGIAAGHDLRGIGTAIAAKNNMLYAAERECRSLVMRELEAADFMISGVEPLFAYGCRADNELKNIGMMLSSKYPGFNRGIVEAMLQHGGE